MGEDGQIQDGSWSQMQELQIVPTYSDLFNAFPVLGGGCLLTSEAPAAFFWALCLILAIGAAAFSAWCRGGRGKDGG